MFVCLWNNQTQTHLLNQLKLNNVLISLFFCGISKPNQTKLNQSKPKTLYFVCLSKPTIQTKPNQTFSTINSKLTSSKKLNQKYLKSLLELRNSCTDLYLLNENVGFWGPLVLKGSPYPVAALEPLKMFFMLWKSVTTGNDCSAFLTLNGVKSSPGEI